MLNLDLESSQQLLSHRLALVKGPGTTLHDQGKLIGNNSINNMIYITRGMSLGEPIHKQKLLKW